MRRGAALETIGHLEERRSTSPSHARAMIDLHMGQLQMLVSWIDTQLTTAA